MKKPYQIVTRSAKESAAVVEEFCQANGAQSLWARRGAVIVEVMILLPEGHAGAGCS